MTTTVIDRIGLLVTNDPTVGEGLLARELARVLGVFERLERIDRGAAIAR